MAASAVPMPEVPGVDVRHSWVRAGEVTLHVAEAGDPGAPPLVLVHGWPQHWWIWRNVMGDLARTHRVICPDLRGHGWSDAPRGDYAKDTLAGDLLALLDALELRDPVPLVGHDWGGWSSFLLAMRAPERVAGLLALSIPPPWSAPRRSPETVAFSSYQVLVSTPVLGQAVLRTVPGFVERLIRVGTENQAAYSDEDLRTYSHVLQDPDRAAATTAVYRTFLLRELRQASRLAAPSVPYRVVIGERDPILRAVELPPAVVERVPGAGHFLPEEAPGVVLERIRALL